MTVRPWLTASVFAMLALAAITTRAAAGEEPISPEKTVPLYNGKDLSGWSTWLADTKHEDPRGVFSVADGKLRISGDGFGYLATEKSYRDYRLIVEFKWGEKRHDRRKNNARDSGLFLHAQGPDGNSVDGSGAYRAGLECQIMQGAVGDLILIQGKDEKGNPIALRGTAAASEKRDAQGWPTFTPSAGETTLSATGRVNWRDKDLAWQDKLDFRGQRDLESRPREWTRVECVCRGDRISVYVGGALVNEMTGISHTAGPILLQCEGAEIFFRRVELHPLSAAPEGEPLADYRVHNVAGWTVHVSEKLLEKKDLAARTLELLSTKLYDVRRMVRPKALAELERIPFWIELADPRHPCACYHISPAWLAANGFSIDKAGAVEIANAENFLSWTRQQPWMVLHELTHGYHDRVLTHGYAPLRECYKQAMKDKRYDSILDFAGNRRRAYAANNVAEYFAEATEAYFGTNDFYPFVRPELREHDPELYKVLERIWEE